MRKTKKHKLCKFGKILESPHHSEQTRNHSLDVFNRSLLQKRLPFLDSVPWTAANTFYVLWIGDCIMLEWFGWLTNALVLESGRETLSTWGKPQCCAQLCAHKRPDSVFAKSLPGLMVLSWQDDQQHLSFVHSWWNKEDKLCIFCVLLVHADAGSPQNRQQSEPTNQTPSPPQKKNHSNISLSRLLCD